jgi:hypothetical protein
VVDGRQNEVAPPAVDLLAEDAQPILDAFEPALVRRSLLLGRENPQLFGQVVQVVLYPGLWRRFDGIQQRPVGRFEVFPPHARALTLPG